MSKEQKPSKTTPKKESVIMTSAQEIQHYNAIMIEELRSQFRAVIEHSTSIEQRLVARMDQTDEKTERRFQDIETILKQHSELHRQNLARWDANDKRWDANDKRWDANDKRLEKIEQRLTGIESKADQTGEKVEAHDHDIQELRSVVLPV